MIKVTTSSGTVYIIDEENKQIKRVPIGGNSIKEVLKGFINVEEFQEYTNLSGLEIDKNLWVNYPGEQNWSISTPIKEIDYGYEEISEESLN